MKALVILLMIVGFIFSCSNKNEEEKNNQSSSVEKPEPGTNTINDWKSLAIPANPGENKKWEFQEISDNFEYDAPAENKGTTFLTKWDDFYHNTWARPGLTEWTRNSSWVSDGLLQFSAKRKEGSEKINTGCVTSKTKVVYPVYIEAKAKLMNSVLSNGIWLLSQDDTQEIDILEAYGASFSESANKSHEWFAKRIHISHHVFIREPFADWQPTDTGSWYTDNTTLWREDFHRYGVYWKDPWHLEFYIDGKLVRTVSGKEQIDPLYHTNSINQGNTTEDTRTGLSKEMDIIISIEDQDWRSNPASGKQEDTYTPSDAELSNQENHTFKVDWIRIYKPVNK